MAPMKMTSKLHKLTFVVAISAFTAIYGEVRLPILISDGMVLQREVGVKIWGWASEGERISIDFIDSTYTTVADGSGNWHVVLAKLNAGGPYEMNITASNSITIRDIMIGDVWVCSGQSNMELPMRRVSWVYPAEIANSANPSIRQFYVPRKYDFNNPYEDFETGSWKSANPENVLEFSAVAYFFANALYDKHDVPIGLINTSLGGSPAEAWMSEEALKAFPAHYEEAQRFKDSQLIKQIEDEDRTRIQGWYKRLRQKDEGYANPETAWFLSDLNTSDWASMEIPGYWADTELGSVNGVVWFRKNINIPSAAAGRPAKLILGRIVDADSVFVNGVFVGSTSYQYPPRRYDIPVNLLRVGENTFVVRVINSTGKGGFVSDKPYEIITDDISIDLRGDWEYRLGTTMEHLESQTFIRWKPLGLFNAMIAPLLNYRIKGVIWYQGESNAGRPIEYRSLFPAMIRDWRKNWQIGDFPFLFVQLANFMESQRQPSESNWAMLREAQLKTLSVPNTGMAVIIDIGEWNDIHPLNKNDVGKRLALAARKVAYNNEKVVYSGPLYKSMRIDDNKIILTFTHVGSGLVAQGGELKHFAICGADSQFVWAQAKIEGDKVIVWSDEISNPVAVRYAWADNPEGANLYNKDGLPASPFRTDEF